MQADSPQSTRWLINPASPRDSSLDFLYRRTCRVWWWLATLFQRLWMNMQVLWMNMQVLWINSFFLLLQSIVALRSGADTSGRVQQVNLLRVSTFVKLTSARMVCFCDVWCTLNTSHGIYHINHGNFDVFRIIYNPSPRSLSVVNSDSGCIYAEYTL